MQCLLLKNNTSPHVLKVRVTSVDKWTNSGEIRKQVFSPTARNDEKQKLEIQIDGTATEGLVHTGAEVTNFTKILASRFAPSGGKYSLQNSKNRKREHYPIHYMKPQLLWYPKHTKTQRGKKKKEYYRSISHMSTDVKMVRYLQIQRKDQKYHIWCSTWLHPRDAEMVQHAKMSGKKKCNQNSDITMLEDIVDTLLHFFL